MARVAAILRLILVVAVTAFATEWLHRRWDPPPSSVSLSDLTDPDDLLRQDSVTESEFEKYLRILEAMQADHELSVEEAARHEHLPLGGFRDLEQRVQRNGMLVERARTTLREKAEALWKERAAPLEHG